MSATRQRFYETVDGERAEFINGEVIVQVSDTKAENEAMGCIGSILGFFADAHELGWVSMASVLVSVSRNDYLPDVCFWKTEKAEGFDDKQMQFPAPDLAVEVLSKSTANTDRETKYDDYEAHGVSEYWIVDSEKRLVEQYVLEEGRYELRMKSGDGLLTCEAIAGLAFPVEAIFDKKLTNKIINRILAEK